jgi:hypothetical protein
MHFHKMHIELIPFEGNKQNFIVDVELFEDGRSVFKSICNKSKDIFNQLGHLLSIIDTQDHAITMHFIDSKMPSWTSHGTDDIMDKIPPYIKWCDDDCIQIIYPPKNDKYQLTITPLLSPMYTTTPILFLDVDGVINKIRQYGSIESTFPIVTCYGGCGNMKFPICYDPLMLNMISILSHRVEIRWLTSWKSKTRFRLAPLLQLPDFTVSTYNKYHFANDLTKEDVSRPIIWIDDELTYTYSKQVEALKTITQQCLCIAPLLSTGLTLEHIEEINTFIAPYC